MKSDGGSAPLPPQIDVETGKVVAVATLETGGVESGRDDPLLHAVAHVIIVSVKAKLLIWTQCENGSPCEGR